MQAVYRREVHVGRPPHPRMCCMVAAHWSRRRHQQGGKRKNPSCPLQSPIPCLKPKQMYVLGVLERLSERGLINYKVRVTDEARAMYRPSRPARQKADGGRSLSWSRLPRRRRYREHRGEVCARLWSTAIVSWQRRSLRIELQVRQCQAPHPLVKEIAAGIAEPDDEPADCSR